MVQVDENSGDSLPTVRTEGPPRLRVRIDAVVVLDIALTVGVSRDLGQLHVAIRLAGEHVDLLKQDGARMHFLGQVAGEACAPFRGLASWKPHVKGRVFSRETHGGV